jgi:hypothetical protein
MPIFFPPVRHRAHRASGKRDSLALRAISITIGAVTCLMLLFLGAVALAKPANGQADRYERYALAGERGKI